MKTIINYQSHHRSAPGKYFDLLLCSFSIEQAPPSQQISSCCCSYFWVSGNLAYYQNFSDSFCFCSCFCSSILFRVLASLFWGLLRFSILLQQASFTFSSMISFLLSSEVFTRQVILLLVSSRARIHLHFVISFQFSFFCFGMRRMSHRFTLLFSLSIDLNLLKNNYDCPPRRFSSSTISCYRILGLFIYQHRLVFSFIGYDLEESSGLVCLTSNFQRVFYHFYHVPFFFGLDHIHDYLDPPDVLSSRNFLNAV